MGGLQIFICHVLGDVISPPIIGTISDRADLQTGMQLTWVMILVAGFWWGLGAVCLPPLQLAASGDDKASVKVYEEDGSNTACEESRLGGPAEKHRAGVASTFGSLFCAASKEEDYDEEDSSDISSCSASDNG